jgi:hypothetical protein
LALYFLACPPERWTEGLHRSDKATADEFEWAEGHLALFANTLTTALSSLPLELCALIRGYVVAGALPTRAVVERDLKLLAN